MISPCSAAEREPERQHHRGRDERMPAGEIEIGEHHADESDHRADREVDAAGQNDEGRADRRGDDEGVVGEDVAENQSRREEVIVEEAADQEQRDEDGDRRKKRKILLVHRFVPRESVVQRDPQVGRLQEQHDDAPRSP